MLTREQVNEIADTPSGVTAEAVHKVTATEKGEGEGEGEGAQRPPSDGTSTANEATGTQQSIANVKRDGTVEFERPDGKP